LRKNHPLSEANTDLPSATAFAKDFKFQLKTKTGTYYLTETGAATTSMASGVNCSINGGKIACGDNKGGLGTAMHSRMTPGSPLSKPNKGWSVSGTGRITYAPNGKAFNLVTKGADQDLAMWVENCDAHPDGRKFTKGTAKAIYI
jgi:hypothetical protein